MEHLITPNMVALSRDEYTQLIQVKNRYEILLPMLIKTASLSYNKEELRLDDNAINAVLCGIEPAAYMGRLEQLRREAADEEG